MREAKVAVGNQYCPEGRAEETVFPESELEPGRAATGRRNAATSPQGLGKDTLTSLSSQPVTSCQSLQLVKHNWKSADKGAQEMRSAGVSLPGHREGLRMGPGRGDGKQHRHVT